MNALSVQTEGAFSLPFGTYVDIMKVDLLGKERSNWRMKFIHLGDLHIGKSLSDFNLIEDQKYILEQILEVAEKQKVDAVLMAGDIYDKSIPSEEAVKLFEDRKIRVAWNEDDEKWYFSIVDVIGILTDSNSGITQKEAQDNGIHVLSMPFMIDGETYYEGLNLNQEQFYEFLEKEAEVSTSQP
jgi:Icc-related predicted phosphoesterase